MIWNCKYNATYLAKKFCYSQAKTEKEFDNFFTLRVCISKIPSFADTLLNVFLAIAVDNLANAQELTAAEEADEKANEIFEDSDSMDDQYGDGQCAIDMDGEEMTREPDGLTVSPGIIWEFKQLFFADEECEEEESPFGGPKPMVPYSSMFILSSKNQ